MNALLIAVRDQFQALLDSYQITGTAVDPYKNAMVQLNNIIETPPAIIAVVTEAPDYTSSLAAIQMQLNTVSSGVINLQAMATQASATAAAASNTTAAAPAAINTAAAAAAPAAQAAQ
jgi:hypothetical protein